MSKYLAIHVARLRKAPLHRGKGDEFPPTLIAIASGNYEPHDTNVAFGDVDRQSLPTKPRAISSGTGGAYEPFTVRKLSQSTNAPGPMTFKTLFASPATLGILLGLVLAYMLAPHLF